MTVIAGVDGSPVSKLVLARAIEEAQWRKTDLHVVHVASLPTFYAEAVTVDWDLVIKAERKAVWELLSEQVAEADMPMQCIDLVGYAPDILVDYAVAQDASLLVVGNRGRGEVASLVLGSTSHRAIHIAPCDVLVVKAQMEDV